MTKERGEPSRAVVLAGGEGTRLRPYTMILPKPLLPITDMPILEILVRQLAQSGFTRIAIASGYLAGLLQAYFDDGRRWNVSIDYTIEEEPLGTAGPLALIDGLDDPFIVTNGDVLTDLDYREFMSFHQERGAIASVATYERDVQVSLGVLEVDEHGDVLSYTEKPKFSYLASMGIYAMQPEVLRFVPNGEHLDLPDLVRTLIVEGERVASYRFSGYWRDLGQPADYQAAIDEFPTVGERILKSEDTR